LSTALTSHVCRACWWVWEWGGKHVSWA
jgi:hypothetical protein